MKQGACFEILTSLATSGGSIVILESQNKLGEKMDFQCFKLIQDNGVAHLELSRPEKRNSMIPEFWKELPALVRKLDSEGETRVLLISSQGKHFCSGMDLSVFSDPSLQDKSLEIGRQREKFRHFVEGLQDAFTALEQARFPVLCAVQGACIGGALDLLAASDCVYCSEDAYFTIAETNIGLVADLGTLQRLPHMIPLGVLKEMAYTGRKVDAQEAKRIGLVNNVYENANALVEGVLEIARSIAGHSPLVVSGCKEMINYSRDHSVADSLRFMSTWQAAMFHGSDMMEAFGAKAKKEQAQFQSNAVKKDIFQGDS
ncbi:MAG: crotonase/enoyl-CoA hydratase family protein [Pseudomonadales bacterium]|nr:crotonase/enoyl-CoA hydratase family protein [Pseudomonadales bacterium]